MGPDRDPGLASRSRFEMLQRHAGNRMTAMLIQHKLRVGAPDDRYEHEADRVADIVLDSPARGDQTERTPHGPMIQRCACGGTCASCADEREEEGLPLQRLAITPVRADYLQREPTESCDIKEEGEDEEEKAEEAEEAAAATREEEEQRQFAPATDVQPKRHAGSAPVAEDVESRIAATRGSGSALPSGTRQYMESRFGYDFSGVRVHTGEAAGGLNRDLNALAFTTGSDIYFAPGQFEPTSRRGQRLLAHELTHVVQQGGGANGVVREKADPRLISRASDDDEAVKGKYYYYTVVISGKRAHHRIEEILRASDANLVTEAAIPGANRYVHDLNLVGVADLYKSKPEKSVSGVKAYNPVATPRDVIAMNDPKKVKTLPAVTSAPKIGGKRDDPNRTWSGNFPEHIWLGEIKPLSTTKVGAGLFQLDSYTQGYQAFVARINQISGGKTRASITVSRLDLSLPAFLNFDNWNSQHGTPNERATIGTRRLWVAHIGSGLYVYFHLASDTAGPPPAWESDQIRQMREIREELAGGKHPRTGKMDTFAAGKFLPGGPRVPIQKKTAGTARLIQRNTKDRPANYWPEQAKKWEEKRAKWGTGFRTSFKTKFKSFSEKVKVEKRLGKTGRAAPAAEQAELRKYKQLLFWSGIPGRFLGKVRFLLGGVWDKILGIFERQKEKMHGMRTRVNAMSEKSFGLGGWRQTLIRIVMAAAKAAVIRFITESFNFFVECFHSAMDKVWQKIQGELTEKFAKELCEARKFFEKSRERLETEWGVSLSQLEQLLKIIGTVKTWTDIATASIQLIRLGVQVISCLTPPALGCLWGLVAQIGISAGLDLLIGTQWFNDRIVNPAVRDLVKAYATPLYQKLINRALGDELKEYHCHLADEAAPQLAGGGEVGGLPLGSELLKHRDSWESRNRETMLKDLKFVFQKGKGRQVSTAELEQLAAAVAELRKNGKTTEEIQTLLEASRDPATGRLKFEIAQANAQAGELPKPAEGEGGEAAAKERKIDYPRATKRNKQLQRELKWDPLTFYKKPGVAVDSEEFADAVYDMQEALRITADGILGEQTLIAFYDRNKLKHDGAYEAAVKRREEKREAKEKAAREKAEKAAKAKAAKEGKAAQSDTGEIVAVSVGKPASGLIEDRYPTEYWAFEGGWITIPIGEVNPPIALGDTRAPGELLTIGVRHYMKDIRRYVWFTDIPATLVSVSSMNDRPWVTFKTDSTYYFKTSTDAPQSYHFPAGQHTIELRTDVASNPFE